VSVLILTVSIFITGAKPGVRNIILSSTYLEVADASGLVSASVLRPFCVFLRKTSVTSFKSAYRHLKLTEWFQLVSELCIALYPKGSAARFMEDTRASDAEI
jgi:hypothetical protein